MTPEAMLAPSPIIDAESEEYAKLQQEYSRVIKEWSEKRAECQKAEREILGPIEARWDAIKKKMTIAGPKPECFGVRNDLDLPECEECGFGALCFRAMKAKGLI